MHFFSFLVNIMRIKHCQKNLRSRYWFATHVRHLTWVSSFFLALKTTRLEVWYTGVNPCASWVQSIKFNSGPTDSPSSLIFPLPVLQMPAKSYVSSYRVSQSIYDNGICTYKKGTKAILVVNVNNHFFVYIDKRKVI